MAARRHQYQLNANDTAASLTAAEEGQVGTGTAVPSQVKVHEETVMTSKYAGMLAVSELQEQDHFYQQVRAFPCALAFLQATIEQDLDDSWAKLRSAVASGDDAKVPALINELKRHVFPFLNITAGRKAIADLKRPRARDLNLFLKYLGYFGASERQHPSSPRQWKALLKPRQFEDWARSIAINKDSMMNKCLRFLVSSRDVTIGGWNKPLESIGKVVWLLETSASLSASLFFGAPLVILASEMFVRWVNIVILVVWVMMFIVLLIWLQVDSSYMFLYILAYTSMIASSNVGGQVGGGWMN